MDDYYHSVVLDNKLCKGCTNCIKKCPTEAIRVRNGKAIIINEKCIDCGECLRTCPYKAKIAQTDTWDDLSKFKYRIALPAPSLYMQFANAPSKEHVIKALQMLGFDYVYEVARGAEIVTSITNKILKTESYQRPVISSACPAVVKLIQLNYPNLIPNLLKIKSPMEMAAINAKKEFCEEHNVSPSEVGVFFISPCAAKMTAVKSPIGISKSNVDGVLSIKTVYFRMFKQLAKIKDEELPDSNQAGYKGVRWAADGGEAVALNTEKILAVDGIHNVIKIFEELENDSIEDVDFIEASACTGGCLGGPLAVENMFVATARTKKFKESLPSHGLSIADSEMEEYEFDCPIIHKDVTKLDTDISEAMRKYDRMVSLCDELPALDCGACGAPSCKALAEDIVRGIADITDCIFVLRRKVRKLAEEMMALESRMPPVIGEENNKKDGDI